MSNNTEALQQLVRVLEHVHDEQKPFNLEHWAQEIHKGHLWWRRQCGTAACAMGWAAADPWFIERGLRLVPCSRRVSTIRYLNFAGWQACCKILGISFTTAQFLFAPQTYPGGKPTALDVATRVHALIASKTELKEACLMDNTK